MRNQAIVLDNSDFLNTQYKSKEQFNLKGLHNFQKGLVKLDSSSSLSSCRSTSDSSKEDTPSPTLPVQQSCNDKKHTNNFHIKKKTELCKTFQLGLPCPYGEKCSFAHGRSELRAKVLVHSNYKTTKCKPFFEKGFCNFGPRCQFLHSAQNRPEPILPSLSHAQLFKTVCNSIEKDGINEGNNYMFNYYEYPISVSETLGAKRLNVFENSSLYC